MDLDVQGVPGAAEEDTVAARMRTAFAAAQAAEEREELVSAVLARMAAAVGEGGKLPAVWCWRTWPRL